MTDRHPSKIPAQDYWPEHPDNPWTDPEALELLHRERMPDDEFDRLCFDLAEQLAPDQVSTLITYLKGESHD